MTTVAFLVLAFFASPPSCDFVDPAVGDRPTACEVRDLALPAVGPLVIDNTESGGSVRVSSWDRDEVSVRATLRAYGGDGRSPADLLAATVIETEGSLRTETEGGGWVEVMYEVRVPRATALNVRTRVGSISVEGVVGRHRLSTRAGAIRLTNVGGDVEAETYVGDVTIVARGETWDGKGLDAVTRTGNVRLELPASFDAVVESATRWGSVGGDARRASETSRQYFGAGGPTIRLRTRMGDIRIARH